jgi:predicted TIM-barrel fold metal-dependent hydrolase
MFGSDVVENLDTELVKYLTSGLSADELRACLGENAKRVFKLG